MATPTKITGKGEGYYPETKKHPGQGINPSEYPFTPTKLGRNPGVSSDPNSLNYNRDYDPNISKKLFGNDEQSENEKQSAGKRRKRSRKGGKWSRKYKRSINCRRPKGFSQKQHCKYGRRSRRR